MDFFSGLDYCKIAVANAWGLNRLSWADRIHWCDDHNPDLETMNSQGLKHPFLFEKSVNMLRKAEQGIAHRDYVELDATASGIQIMSALFGCTKTAKATNLIDTNARRDVYQDMANVMNKKDIELFKGYDEAGEPTFRKVTRNDIKKPLMTYMYGSEAQPKQLFGEGEELDAFYDTLMEHLPGAVFLRNMFLQLWDPMARYYEWTMPDGHHVHIPVLAPASIPVEIDEANHTRFTMVSYHPIAKEKGKSLAANIVHSADAWVNRQLILRLKDHFGIDVVSIHDCFLSHPNDGNHVRYMYNQLLAELHESNWGNYVVDKLAKDRGDDSSTPLQVEEQFGDLIRQANYALS